MINGKIVISSNMIDVNFDSKTSMLPTYFFMLTALRKKFKQNRAHKRPPLCKVKVKIQLKIPNKWYIILNPTTTNYTTR